MPVLDDVLFCYYYTAKIPLLICIFFLLVSIVDRSMDFTIALLQKLEDTAEQSLAQLVEAAYQVSLKPWHGWISSAACKVRVCSLYAKMLALLGFFMIEVGLVRATLNL